MLQNKQNETPPSYIILCVVAFDPKHNTWKADPSYEVMVKTITTGINDESDTRKERERKQSRINKLIQIILDLLTVEQGKSLYSLSCPLLCMKRNIVTAWKNNTSLCTTCLSFKLDHFLIWKLNQYINEMSKLRNILVEIW